MVSNTGGSATKVAVDHGDQLTIARVARRQPGRAGERGQGLVEFSIAITVFLLLVMGTIDLGRAVYQFNGVSQAARELARVASVHPGGTLGTSSQATSTLAAQRGLVPGLGTPDLRLHRHRRGHRDRAVQWRQLGPRDHQLLVHPRDPAGGADRGRHVDQLGERKDRMTRGRDAMFGRQQDRERGDRAANGQVLVVFALSLITLLGFAGLALDGGSTFAQRRSQQTAADMAALAAANDYLVNGSAVARHDPRRDGHAGQRIHARLGRHDGDDGRSTPATASPSP